MRPVLRSAAWAASATVLAGFALLAAGGRPLECPHGQGCPAQLPPAWTPPDGIPGPAVVVVAWLAAMIVVGVAMVRRRAGAARPSETGWAPAGAALSVAVGTGLAVVAAHAFLFSPLVARPFCAEPVHLGLGAGYAWNCDSDQFVALARNPGLLFEPGQTRQSRPVLTAITAALARTAGSALLATPARGAYALRSPEHAAFIVLDLGLLAAALAGLLRMLPLRTAPVATASLLTWLAFDDDVKAFFWTPHAQLFNVLVPVAALAAAWLGWRGAARLPAVAWAALGFAIGVGGLAYGSFVVAAAAAGVAAAIVLLRARRFSRTAVVLGALAAGFALPNVAWIEACNVFAGGYSNGESNLYWEFTWVAKLAGDPSHLLRYFFSLLVLSDQVTLAQVGPLALLAVLATGAALILGVKAAPDRSGLLAAAAIVLAVASVFLAFLGIYTGRISFMLAPPLAVIAALEIEAVAARSPAAGRLLTAVTVVLAVTAVFFEVGRQGPYS